MLARRITDDTRDDVDAVDPTEYDDAADAALRAAVDVRALLDGGWLA